MSEVTAEMTAYRIHRFGGPEVLQRDRLPTPEPGDNDVLVRVQASSVNPVDIKTREGRYPLICEDALPYTLGRDFAGEVVQVGSAVNQGKSAEKTAWKCGDEVYAFVGQGPGAFADYVKVDASALARRPVSADILTAGAVPLAALTAWQGLFDHGHLERNERVLIHAGAGGVGHFAVQFAKTRGAEVFVTASGDGAEFLRSLGADHVIDYHAERFEDVVREVDLVFDLVGGETQARSWSVVAKGGALISTLNEPSAAEAAARGARGERYTARPDGSQLAQIGALIDDGHVHVQIASMFSFDALAQALKRLEEGHVRGKIVVGSGEE